MKKIVVVLLAIIAFLAVRKCETDKSEAEKLITANQPVIVEPIETTPKPEYEHKIAISNKDIARFTIAKIMNQPPKNIKATVGDGFYRVSYKSKSDGETKEFKVKIEGSSIIWGNIDGRWRDSEYDEKLSYLDDTSTLTIIETFSDGSLDTKTFSKSE